MTDADTRDGLAKAVVTVQCSENSKKGAKCSDHWPERLEHCCQDVLVGSVPHITSVKK